MLERRSASAGAREKNRELYDIPPLNIRAVAPVILSAKQVRNTILRSFEKARISQNIKIDIEREGDIIKLLSNYYTGNTVELLRIKNIVNIAAAQPRNETLTVQELEALQNVFQAIGPKNVKNIADDYTTANAFPSTGKKLMIAGFAIIALAVVAFMALGALALAGLAPPLSLAWTSLCVATAGTLIVESGLYLGASRNCKHESVLASVIDSRNEQPSIAQSSSISDNVEAVQNAHLTKTINESLSSRKSSSVTDSDNLNADNLSTSISVVKRRISGKDKTLTECNASDLQEGRNSPSGSEKFEISTPVSSRS